MSVFVLAPKEDWICDRFVTEWNQAQPYPTSTSIEDSSVIWLLADWCWNKVSPNLLIQKKVVASVHHIVPNKFDKQQKEDFLERDKYVDLYHVPCEKTKEQILPYTKKPIWVQPFWVNQNIWKGLSKKLRQDIRTQYGISDNCFLIGSFQRDTEGHDLKSPKLEKGPDLFCDAVEELRDFYKTKNVEVRVLLAGWRRQYVIRRLKDANIPYYYSELPPMSDINTFYNILDLYIVAARFEGGPQSIVECALTKTPIVSTDVGISDIILSPGSIFQPGNVKMAKPDVEYAYESVSQYSMPTGFMPFVTMFEKLMSTSND